MKIDKLKKSTEIASIWHHDQGYGPFDYLYHLVAVANEFLIHFKDIADQEPEMLSVCWLHDLFEDTKCPRNMLEYLDPEYVEMIELLTNKPGKNRAERHANTYPALAANYRASCVKICDRIVNVKHANEHHDRLFEMYKKENDSFLKYFEHWQTEEFCNARNKLLELIKEGNENT